MSELFPFLVACATFLGAVGAGALAFIAAKHRRRGAWTWAIAAFLFIVPAVVVVQLGAPSDTSHNPKRWWLRILGAGTLIAAAFVVDAVPIASSSIAALEARTAAFWNSDRAVLAEGPVLHTAKGQLVLTGNPTRPVILALVGGALGILILHRTLVSIITLALTGALLGLSAWVARLISSTNQWLNNPAQAPQPPTEYVGVAFFALLWISVAYSWYAKSRQRAP